MSDATRGSLLNLPRATMTCPFCGKSAKQFTPHVIGCEFDLFLGNQTQYAPKVESLCCVRRGYA